jgi:hypothetical protein
MTPAAPLTRLFVEETPSTWSVHRLFRCCVCGGLFAIRFGAPEPAGCPKCRTPFCTEAQLA